MIILRDSMPSDILQKFIDENCPGTPKDSPKLTELLVTEINKMKKQKT